MNKKEEAVTVKEDKEFGPGYAPEANRFAREVSVEVAQHYLCGYCGGSGEINDKTCPDCGGAGVY